MRSAATGRKVSSASPASERAKHGWLQGAVTPVAGKKFTALPKEYPAPKVT